MCCTDSALPPKKSSTSRRPGFTRQPRSTTPSSRRSAKSVADASTRVYSPKYTNPRCRVYISAHTAAYSTAATTSTPTIPRITPSGLGLVLVRVDRDAGAHHVLVAPDVVDARDRRPVLLLPQRRQRERRQLARVRVRPFAARHRRRGVRRVLERVVLAIEAAVGDRADLLADLDHRVDETVELVLRLALGRLDHQRAGHREAERRRMEAEVDQALGDVLGTDAGLVLQRPQVEDALVRDEPVAAGVQRLVVAFEALRDVVRVEQRDLRRAAQA